MKVFSLLGFQDYAPTKLLGVFASLESLGEFVEHQRNAYAIKFDGTRRMSFGYDYIGFVESELDQEIDQSEMVESFD